MKVTPERNRQEFLKRGIGILEAETMLERLLELIRSQKAKGRKEAHLEPLLWILHTLQDMGKIQA